MRAIYAPLAESEECRKILKLAEKDRACLLVDGCASSQKLHLISALASGELSGEGASLRSGPRTRVILTYSDLRAREIAEEYALYDKNAVLFPAKDLIFYQADVRGRELEMERIRALKKIMEGKPVTVICTFAALMTPQLPIQALKGAVLSLEKRGTLDLDRAAARLLSMGYEKNFKVEQPGQFAIRGDILDIFDLTEDNPFRIELWGDEIESIRSFDVLSQRSVQQLETLQIYPASEMILGRDRLYDGLARIEAEAAETVGRLKNEGRVQEAARLRTSIDSLEEQVRELEDYGALESYIHYFYPRTEDLLDLFLPEKTMIFMDEPHRIGEHARAVELEFRESMISRSEKGYILPGQMGLLEGTEAVLSRMEDFRRVGLAELAVKDPFFMPDHVVSVHARNITSLALASSTSCN
ncbi:MAG: hypothetical protein IIU47_07040 [Lachnospiraceae bacterium]|nr:hypothetical protein [Lachnospiraceae bacterium]